MVFDAAAPHVDMLQASDVQVQSAACCKCQPQLILSALQLLAQAADALSLGDDVTRQVRGLGSQSSTSEGLLPQPGILQHNHVLEKERCEMQLPAARCCSLLLTSACRLQVRQYQNWSLMPFAAVIGNVYPAAYVRGNRFGFGLYPGDRQAPSSTTAQQALARSRGSCGPACCGCAAAVRAALRVVLG